MPYESPNIPSVNESVNNLNDRSPTSTKFAQLVNACPVNETFVSSHCDPESGGEISMQKYIYTCRRTDNTYSAITGNVIGSRPVYRIRDGHCEDDEICVTSHAPRLIASCVKVWLFDDFHIDKDGHVRPMLGGEIFSLDNLMVYAAVSESNARKAVELSSLGVDAWNTGETVDNKAVQSEKCRNCMEVSTDTLEPKTDSLRVEATLMTTGAMAGILWLGLMSG